MWSNDEICDVLLLFKMIQLDPNFKNNYKKLSRRIADVGWQRDNNSCRQQVFYLSFKVSCQQFFHVYECKLANVLFIQIDRLKKRFDAMQAASKKTGSVLYFKPLRVELNDCFGALKDVSPDMVFSNRKGMESGSTDNAEGNVSNSNSNEVTTATSAVAELSTSSKKKPTKSNY